MHCQVNSKRLRKGYPERCKTVLPCRRQHRLALLRLVLSSMPQPYVFNHTLGVDVAYLAVCDGTTFMFLNMVDIGTVFQQMVLLREGKGTPTSLQCLDAMMQRWASWAGYTFHDAGAI